MLVILPFLALTIMMYLVIRGASIGCDREAEDEEQIAYLKAYQAKHRRRK